MMSYSVELWLFDLSNGMAKQLSPAFVGREIEGIWHTSVIVYGKVCVLCKIMLDIKTFCRNLSSTERF